MCNYRWGCCSFGGQYLTSKEEPSESWFGTTGRCSQFWKEYGGARRCVLPAAYGPSFMRRLVVSLCAAGT